MSEQAEFTFTWVIENFNVFLPFDEECLLSPKFTVKSFFNTNWYLRLYPVVDTRRSKEYISVYLERDYEEVEPEVITLECVISINGIAKKRDKLAYKEETSFGWKMFVDRKLMKQSSVLNVECHMKMCSNGAVGNDDTEKSTYHFMPCFLKSDFKIPGVIKETSVDIERDMSTTREALQLFSNQILVRTRVLAERTVITCIIKDYLCPGSERKQHIPVALPTASIIITLLTTKKDESELLDFEICVETEWDHYCKLICKIELIDFERKVHITAEQEHLFEDEYDRSWFFEQSFNWNEVKKQKKASLRFTLTYSEGDYFSNIQWKTDMDDCVGILNYSNEVCKDLHRMFTEKNLCDVTLQVKDESFEAHKTVLCSRSPVFAAMFKSGMKENNTNVIEIDDLDSNTVSQMLHFMYTGIVEDLNADNAIKLFSAADKYEIVSLEETCKNVLKNNLNLQNVCSVLLLADAHQDDALLECCVSFISYHRIQILASDEWDELQDNYYSLAIETLKKICKNPFP